MYDFAIIGGGIVGLANGDELRSTLSRCADCSAGKGKQLHFIKRATIICHSLGILLQARFQS